MSRLLTTDELKKRGFGEALYANSTPAQRAARLQRDDMRDMDLRIRRREEWMAVNTMLENACFIQEYVDDQTKGKALSVKFYEGTSDHLYTVAKPWTTFMEMRADIIAMCRMLSYRGLPAGACREEPPYIRVLGMNATGAKVLSMAKGQTVLPLSHSLARLERLGGRAKAFTAMEVRAADLYGLLCPAVPPCGTDYTNSIITL